MSVTLGSLGIELSAKILMNVKVDNTTAQNMPTAPTLKVPMIVSVKQDFREMALFATIPMNVNSHTITFTHTVLLGAAPQIQCVLTHLAHLFVSAIRASLGIELSVIILTNVKMKNTTAQNMPTVLILKVPFYATVNQDFWEMAMRVRVILDILLLLMGHSALTSMNVKVENITAQNLPTAPTLKVPMIVSVSQDFWEMVLFVTIPMNVSSLTTTFIHIPILGAAPKIQCVLIHLAHLTVSAIRALLRIEHPVIILTNVKVDNTTAQNMPTAPTLKVPMIANVIQGFQEMVLFVTIPMNVSSLTTTFIHIPILGVVPQIQCVLTHLAPLTVSAIQDLQGTELCAKTSMNVTLENTVVPRMRTAMILQAHIPVSVTLDLPWMGPRA